MVFVCFVGGWTVSVLEFGSLLCCIPNVLFIHYIQYGQNGFVRQFVALQSGQSCAVQFEVYPKFDDNLHISMDASTQYPPTFSRDYDKQQHLSLTPQQSKLKQGDYVYLFTHSIPHSMFRPVVVSDIPILQNGSNLITFQSVHQESMNRVYGHWAQYALEDQNDLKYVIVRDRQSLNVEIVEESLDEILQKYDQKCLYRIGHQGKLRAIDEEESLEKQGIKTGDVLMIRKPNANSGGTGSMPVLVVFLTKKEIECWMNPNDTIGNLKALIHQIEFGSFLIAFSI